MAQGTLRITGDDDADDLLNSNGTALLIGMLLDQQIPMGWAFRGPHTLKQRLGHLDATEIASMPVDEFVALCCAKPAIHRFPASMARRIHATCEVLADTYSGDGAGLWKGVADAEELARRLGAMPGFGAEKTMILIALLAKRFGVTPRGWEEVAGPFADSTPRSAADVDGPEALAQVRQWKQSQRSKGKSKQD